MCTNPISLRTGILVGCGHCQQCLKAYQDQWIARLNSEIEQWRSVGLFKPCVFFTLKYREDTVPHSYFNVHTSGVSITDYVPVKQDLFCPVYKFHTDLKELKSGAWKIRKQQLLSIVAGLRDEQENAEGGSTWHSACPSGPAVASFEFNTVRKKDVQDWLKRGRIALTRKYPDVFGAGQNPRQKSVWRDVEGNEHNYPSCSLTPTVKYFITSEYGPRTFRPHLHGVMLGVTYNEFKKCFAEDWQRNFGSVEFQLYDPARGAFSYIAKYCSKGSYEHPYCSKDFFYPSGMEYHSKDYEYCVQDFGINKPFVTHTFHLISKGLGVAYCFNAELQEYFGSRLEAVCSPSGRVSYIVHDSHPDKVNYVPVTGLFDSRAIRSESLELTPLDDYGFLIRRYQLGRDGDGNRVKTLVGESVLTSKAVVNHSLEERLLSKKYSRTYVKKSQNTPSVHGPVHLIGHGITEASTSTTSISLPRYYRRWLLSPLAQCLRASAAYLLYPSLDEQAARIVQQQGYTDSAINEIESLVRSEKMRRQDITLRLRKSTERFFQSSVIREGIS